MFRAPLTLLTLTLASVGAVAAAQTAPPAAPVTPPVSSTPVTNTPVTNTPVTNTPVAVPPSASAPAASTAALSALAVELSSAVKGRLVDCPKSLKVNRGAYCLYTQSTLATLRPLVRGRLGTRALGDWKTSADGKTSSLLLRTGTLNGYVLIGSLGTDALLVVDTVAAAPAAAARPATPQGVVRGQPYVLGSDLKGLVTVTSLGAGNWRLSSGAASLTLSVGKKAASLSGAASGNGAVELPYLPATDGRNLILPLETLRALACTFGSSAGGLKVSCGDNALTVRPLIF